MAEIKIKLFSQVYLGYCQSFEEWIASSGKWSDWDRDFYIYRMGFKLIEVDIDKEVPKLLNVYPLVRQPKFRLTISYNSTNYKVSETVSKDLWSETKYRIFEPTRLKCNPPTDEITFDEARFDLCDLTTTNSLYIEGIAQSVMYSGVYNQQT